MKKITAILIVITLLCGVTACVNQTDSQNNQTEKNKEILFKQAVNLSEKDISKIVLSNVRTGTESEIIELDEIKKTFDALANQKMVDTAEKLPVEHPAGPIFEIDFYSNNNCGHVNYLFNQGFRKEGGYNAEIGASGCKASDYNTMLISLCNLFESHHVLFEGEYNKNQLSDLREEIKKAKEA